MEISEYGYVKLGVAVIERAVDDYKSLLRRVNRARLPSERRMAIYDLERLENSFFRESPIMGILPCTSEDVIREMRKQVALERVKEGE